MGMISRYLQLIGAGYAWLLPRYRAEILEFLGMRRSDLRMRLTQELGPRGMTPGAMTDRLISWFFERKIECPDQYGNNRKLTHHFHTPAALELQGCKK
jgi:hypothetical protein